MWFGGNLTKGKNEESREEEEVQTEQALKKTVQGSPVHERKNREYTHPP